MNRRNWLELSRKLVDRTDMDQSFDWIDQARGELELDTFGKGVLKTKAYPSPLALALSGVDLEGTFTAGIAYDENGQRIKADPGGDFTIAAADPVDPRRDLIVARFAYVEDVVIPKPSDPITTTFLNLLDGFEIITRPGVPAAVPAYPAAQLGDVILGGLLVPAAALVGTDCTLDLTIREKAGGQALHTLEQEELTGTVDGINADFDLSKEPVDDSSLIVLIDYAAVPKTAWTRVGLTVTMQAGYIPAPAQAISAIYMYDNF